MRSILLSLTAIVAAIVALALWGDTFWQTSDDGSVAVTNTREASSVENAPLSTDFQGTRPAFAEAPSARLADFQPSELLSGERPSQVAWLVRNGFAPLSLQKEVGTLAPPVDTVDSSDGLTAEEILYLKNIAMLGPAEQRRAAKDKLMEGAALGSIAALAELANIHSTGATPNAVAAETYRIAAGVRGDWAASLWAESVRPLSGDERVRSTIGAHHLLSQLNRVRQLRGLPPLQYDQRQGVNEAFAELRNPQKDP